MPDETTKTDNNQPPSTAFPRRILHIFVLFLSDDTWYRKRAIHPSKQQHDLSARYVSSRVFLAAAMVDRSLPHGDGLLEHSLVNRVTNYLKGK
jgi:hypothetical protein